MALKQSDTVEIESKKCQPHGECIWNIKQQTFFDLRDFGKLVTPCNIAISCQEPS